LRKKACDRNALTLRGCGQSSFSRTHIGPALQQLTRVADGESLCDRRIIARCEIRVEFAGASSRENRQAVFRTRDIKVEGWNGGFNGRHTGGGTCNILFFTHPGITTELRQPEGLALVPKAALGYSEAPLCAPELEIITSKLGDHANLHIMKVRFERLVLGPSCRDSVANPSEKVCLPESIKPGAESIDCATLVPETRNLLFAVLVGCSDGHRGKTIQLPFIEDRARLGEARACDSNAVV